MLLKRLGILSALFLTSFVNTGFAFANETDQDNRPTYEMRGMSTDLWDGDVDYYSPPIVLVRSSATAAVHRIEFNVNRYTRFCSYWENRCTQYDNQGCCVRWERVCGRWDFQAYPVAKQIDLNLRKAAALDKDDEETFELTIRKFKPFGEGEDQVMTDIRAEKVLKPVVIRRMGDFNYSIETK